MENELSCLVDALPGMVWTAFPNGHFDFFNRRWCVYTGLTLEEACGGAWTNAVHAEDLADLLNGFQLILSSGESLDLEARLRRFDGEYRWFLFRACPLTDTAGQRFKWCGTFTDIHDRTRTEKPVRSCADEYHSVADSIPALIAFMTPAGAVESVNRHALEYYGATLEELKGWAANDTVHPDDLARVRATWMRSLETGEAYDIEHRIRRSDGAYRWFRVRGLPLKDTEGRIVRWCVQQTEVDDRKRAEALLAGEKRLLEMVATGESLSSTLATLCLLVEELCPRCVCCSILLLDAGTGRLSHAASPNVPKAYTEAIDGFLIGPEASACGTAAYYGKQVIAFDIKVDPRWEEFRDLALANGLRACWSTPIFSQENRTLGTFAIFSAKPGNPTPEDQELIAQVTHLASIAIERERSQKSLTQALFDLKKSESKLRTIIHAIPGFVWSATPDGSVDFVNRRWCDYTGIDMEAATGEGWLRAVHPEDMIVVLDHWRSSLASGKPGEFEARLRRFDGSFRWFLIQSVPLCDETGQFVKWFGQNTDIDDRKQAESLLEREKRLLEMMARGNAMPEILEALCHLVESTAKGCFCSVVLVDPSGTRLEHGAAPSLPASFIASIIGRPVNVDAGPSAMAACLKEQVISTDLKTETRWAAYDWCPMALAHGLQACWSTPISSTAGRTLGAFAIYYQEPGTPTPRHQALIGQLTHVASIAIERAMSVGALTHSEARKAAILDSALDCIVTIDHEGCITEFNPAAERTFGHRRDQVIGRQLAEVIIPPRLREQHKRGLAHYLSTGEDRVLGRRIEMSAIRADGTEFPVELAITRIPLDGLPSFTGYLRDITERKRSEEKLRRSEAYLAEAQRLSLTGSFGWNALADEHFWSEETFRIFEYHPSTKVTLPLIMERVLPQDMPIMKQALDLAADGKSIDYECRFLMPGGAVKHLHIVAHATDSQDGRLEYIGAVQDVTERKLSEETLDKIRSELAYMARVTSLGALTASIAHEVNQPLSGIVTNASTCLRMLAADPPNLDGARETARRTIRDGNRASDVITRLRALFGKKDAASETVDLNEATREVIALSWSDLQRNRIIMNVELAGDLPALIGDRVQLQQVILNLLLNGSDAMSSVEDRPRQLLIRTGRDGDHIRLDVRDAGVGFEPQRVDKLFEAFYTTKSNGMGIGLSVSRSIIESHHGRLWATLNDGPGSTFSFSIPHKTDGAMRTHNLGVVSTPAVPGTAQAMRNP